MLTTDPRYNGTAQDGFELIKYGNRLLLQREQRDVIQETYSQISLWSLPPGAPIVVPWLQQADALLSFLAVKNPMRRGPAFQELVPNGNLAFYADRWIWIDDGAAGMLSIWTGDAGGIGYTAQERLNLVNETMRDAALDYANFPERLP